MKPGSRAETIVLVSQDEINHIAYLEEIYEEIPFGSSEKRQLVAPIELGKFATGSALFNLERHQRSPRAFSVTRQKTNEMLQTLDR